MLKLTDFSIKYLDMQEIIRDIKYRFHEL